MKNDINKLLSELENNPDTVRKLKDIIDSPDGRQLVNILNQDGVLQNAASAIQSGDQAKIKDALNPIMSSKETMDLANKLNKKIKG